MLSSLKSRAAAFVRAHRVAAPARSAAALNAAGNGPLVVAGLFSTASGIGESARVCADALEARGHTVTRCDLSDAFRQRDMPGALGLAPFPDAATGTVIVHLNAPEIPKALTSLGLVGGRRWRVIGYWVWELETIPTRWAGAQRHVTEVWTPSPFSGGALSKALHVPVRIATHRVRPPRQAPTGNRLDVPDGDVMFLTMADGRSSLSRKNITGTIEAFQRGVGSDPRCWLVVKTRNLGAHSALEDDVRGLADGHPRIRILNVSLSNEERWALMAGCDVFVSLHRSEGFGLTMAEAMALGKPTVATGWSGNMTFMDADTARLAPHRLVPVEDTAGLYGAPGAVWAEPDLDVAGRHLRDLAANADLRQSLGARGQAHVCAVLDGSGYVTALEAPSGP